MARAPITDANPTVAGMALRVARFQALRPAADDVDSHFPGCERTTCRVIGKIVRRGFLLGNYRRARRDTPLLVDPQGVSADAGHSDQPGGVPG